VEEKRKKREESLTLIQATSWTREPMQWWAQIELLMRRIRKENRRYAWCHVIINNKSFIDK
jgi:hypothetical protein